MKGLRQGNELGVDFAGGQEQLTVRKIRDKTYPGWEGGLREGQVITALQVRGKKQSPASLKNARPGDRLLVKCTDNGVPRTLSVNVSHDPAWTLFPPRTASGPCGRSKASSMCRKTALLYWRSR